MSDKDNRGTQGTAQDGFSRSGNEGFNLNPTGARKALPATTPKSPPKPAQKPKES